MTWYSIGLTSLPIERAPRRAERPGVYLAEALLSCEPCRARPRPSRGWAPPAEARRRTMTSSGIGASVKRREDVRLGTGQGRYPEDYDAPGQPYAPFVRPPPAHADVVAIDGTPPLALPR